MRYLFSGKLKRTAHQDVHENPKNTCDCNAILNSIKQCFVNLLVAKNSSSFRTVAAFLILFLVALLTRNLYSQLSQMGGPLYARGHEQEPTNALQQHHLTDENHDHAQLNNNKDAGKVKNNKDFFYDPLDRASFDSKNVDPMKDKRWISPEADDEALKLSDKTCVCPQIAHCHDDAIEMKCLNYLADRSNVVSVKFDGSITKKSSLRKGRAPILFIEYKNSCVRGIAKMRSELLPLAPESEYLAYHVDRAMHFSRVPPTTIIFLPVSMIENSAGTEDEKKWIRRMVIQPAKKRKAIVNYFPPNSDDHQKSTEQNSSDSMPIKGIPMMYVSVQLMLFSARSARGTPLQVSDSFLSLLRYDVLLQRTLHWVIEAESGRKLVVAGDAELLTPAPQDNDNGEDQGPRPPAGEVIAARRKAERERKRASFYTKPFTARDISALLGDFVDIVEKQHQSQKVRDAINAKEHHNNNGGQYFEGDATLAAGADHQKEDDDKDWIQDANQRNEALSEESKSLDAALHSVMANRESFNQLLGIMSDRAVFDAVIGSDVSSAVHGGESPLQSASARVYVLRHDQVPEACLPWSPHTDEQLVRIRDDGSAQFVLATSTDKYKLIQSTSDVIEGKGGADSEHNLKFLMPLWIQNEGAFRRRGFMTPGFRGVDPSVPGSVCLLRGRTYHVIRKAAERRVWRTMLTKRIHEKVLERFSKEQIFDWPEKRLEQMVAHQEQCGQVLGPSKHWLVW